LDSRSNNEDSQVTRGQFIDVEGNNNQPLQGLIVQENNSAGVSSQTWQSIFLLGDNNTEYKQSLQDLDENSEGAIDSSDQTANAFGNENIVNQALETQNVNSNGSSVQNTQAVEIQGNNNKANVDLTVQQTNDSGATVNNEQIHDLTGDGNVLDESITKSRLLRGTERE